MPSIKYRQSLKTTGLIWDELFVAAVDMSGACALYKWVQPGSVFGQVIPATGASNPYPIGILQSQTAAGGLARVRVMGKSLMTACMGACGLNAGDWVSCGSGGVGVHALTAACMANARYAGSGLASALAPAQTAEVYLLGPSFATCINSAS